LKFPDYPDYKLEVQRLSKWDESGDMAKKFKQIVALSND
jgi:hypothetical protein